MGADIDEARRGRSRVLVFLIWLVLALLLLAAAGYGAWHASPWPSALFYRFFFDRGGVAMARGLEKHVPPTVAEQLDIRYDPADTDALLDVFYPRSVTGSGEALPTIVWIHGGGFISGDKSQIAPYAKIVAANGYTVIGVNYTIAPEARYPVPLRQINVALAYLVRNAQRLHVDPTRIVLAGDSAGAQLAAQMSAIVSDPAYAKQVGIQPAVTRPQLRGALLFCGIYDKSLIRFEGAFAGFLRTVGWSYLGSREFLGLQNTAQFSVVDHVTKDFPPAFVTAGNADPLLPHSLSLADALAKKGVPVDRLFYPPEYTPRLNHEYQFVLENEAGRLALSRVMKFLAGVVK
jgi:acetyl esterase